MGSTWHDSKPAHFNTDSVVSGYRLLVTGYSLPALPVT